MTKITFVIPDSLNRAAAAAIAHARSARRGAPQIENVLELLERVSPHIYADVLEDGAAAFKGALQHPDFDALLVNLIDARRSLQLEAHAEERESLQPPRLHCTLCGMPGYDRKQGGCKYGCTWTDEKNPHPPLHFHSKQGPDSLPCEICGKMYTHPIHHEQPEANPRPSAPSVVATPAPAFVEVDESLHAEVKRALDVLKNEAKVSISMLQRQLHLGYVRAANVMDELVKRQLVSARDPHSGTNYQQVLRIPTEEDYL